MARIVLVCEGEEKLALATKEILEAAGLKVVFVEKKDPGLDRADLEGLLDDALANFNLGRKDPR